MVTPSKGRTHGPGMNIVRLVPRVINPESRRDKEKELTTAETSGGFSCFVQLRDIICETTHESCDLREVALGPCIECGHDQRCVRCSKRACNAAAFCSGDCLADPPVVFAGLALDQAQVNQLADLSGNSRVITADKVAQFDHADRAFRVDLEEKPRQRCVKLDAGFLKNAIVKLGLIQIGGEIGKSCCQRSEIPGSL